MLKNYKLNSKNITEIPFHYLTNPATTHLMLGIEQRAADLLPQALAFLNKNVTLVRNIEGKVSPELSLATTAEKMSRESSSGSEQFTFLGGLIEYLTRVDRASIIGKLVQKRTPAYSALVPLVLSAFKTYRKIGYEEWDFSSAQMQLLVDPKLYECMNTNVDWAYENLSKEDLIGIREASRTVKSGASAGKVKDLTDIYRINNVGIPEFDTYPSLVKTILCQTWLAHPRVRNPLMVLELPTYDAMPEPLEEETLDVAKYSKDTVKPWGKFSEELDWTK